MEHVRRTHHTKRKARTASPKEQRRAIKLTICIIILLTAVCIKLLCPEVMNSLKDRALHYIGGDVDYEAALSVFGEAIAGERSFKEAIAQAYEYAFKISDENASGQEINQDETVNEVVNEAENDTESTEPEQSNSIQTEQLANIHEGEESPPEDASYNKASIEFEYCIPVEAQITSSFGYRDSPADGIRRFHYGTDFGADEGTDILSFGDGTVYAIGESSTLGLYVMIDHAEGVRTIYGHCSELMVHSGDNVSMGQKIAEVGATGNATGNCLHFELIINGIYIDPEYYF